MSWVVLKRTVGVVLKRTVGLPWLIYTSQSPSRSPSSLSLCLYLLTQFSEHTLHTHHTHTTPRILGRIPCIIEFKFPAFVHHQANPPQQYLSSIQHQSPAFSRRRSEHTDRNVELKATVIFRTTPTVLFRTTPTHRERSLHGVTANISLYCFANVLLCYDLKQMLPS